MNRPPTFRETLWFKVGDLGEQQPLPIEDAYADDGQVTGIDTFDHGVHSGETSEMPLLLIRNHDVIEMDRRWVQVVARELRRSSTQIAAVVGASIMVIVVVFMLAF